MNGGMYNNRPPYGAGPNRGDSRGRRPQPYPYERGPAPGVRPYPDGRYDRRAPSDRRGYHGAPRPADGRRPSGADGQVYYPSRPSSAGDRQVRRDIPYAADEFTVDAPPTNSPAPAVQNNAAPAFEDIYPDFDDDFNEEFEDEFSHTESTSNDTSMEDDFEDDFDDDFDDEPPLPIPVPQPPIAHDRPAENLREPLDDDLWGDMEPPRREKAPRPRPANCDRPVQRRTAEPHRFQPPAFDLTSKILAACLALICVFSMFLIPSGTYVNRSIISDGQRAASFDLKQGFDLLSSNVINSVNGLPKVYVLPMSESPASLPREDCYSSYTDEDGDVHEVYSDDTITVDCSRKRYTVEEYTVTAAVAKVKVSHPTQIRSAFAGGEYSKTKREKPSRIAAQANAVVALNGELYNYAGRNTILIRNSIIYNNPPSFSGDVLFIDSKGDFIIRSHQEAVDEGLLTNSENKIYHTVAFGPPLVVDGVTHTNDYLSWTNYGSRNPRSAIGQTGPLEYVLVAVEGRAAHSKGLNIHCLSILMEQLGCTQAYNLDGGQSSMLIFHNKLYNMVSNGSERSFADIIYFGSALPEQ